MRTWHLGKTMPTVLGTEDHSFSLWCIIHRTSGSSYSFCMWVCKVRAGTGLSALNVGSFCFCSGLDAWSLNSTLARDQAGVKNSVLISEWELLQYQIIHIEPLGESNRIFHHFLHRQKRPLNFIMGAIYNLQVLGKEEINNYCISIILIRWIRKLWSRKFKCAQDHTASKTVVI